MTSLDHNEVLKLLDWLAGQGIDALVREDPVDRTQLAEPPTPKALPPQRPPARALEPTPTIARAQPAPAPEQAEIKRLAEAAALRAQSLGELLAAMEAFDACPLKRTAHTTVFADGDPSAHVMFVGEAPGRDEDRMGKPFVGRSGQLLDRMLAAIGLSRAAGGAAGAYITNVVPWRPTGNRPPTQEEADLCAPFLVRHIALVRPRLVVALGAIAARATSGVSGGILKARGRWGSFVGEADEIPVLATLHPAYLLRQPGQKSLAWRDLLSLKARLDALPPA